MDSIAPTVAQCAFLDESRDVEGSWDLGGNSLWNVCVDDDEYEGSYDTTSEGYETGTAFESGAVVSGIYYNSADDSTGYSVAFILADGTLGNFWWRQDDLDEPINILNINDESEHLYDIYQYRSTTTSSACAENRDLANSNNNSSVASSLTSVTILLVSFMFLFVL